MPVENVSGFPVAATPKATTNTDTSNSMSMDKEDFLLLFLESLKNQDPMAPMDNAQMMQQLSQLGQMEAVANLKIAVEEMKQTTSRNQLSQGASLLDQTVIATDNTGNYVVGKATAYRLNDGVLEYLVNNKVVQIGQIQEVVSGADSSI